MFMQLFEFQSIYLDMRMRQSSKLIKLSQWRNLLRHGVELAHIKRGDAHAPQATPRIEKKRAALSNTEHRRWSKVMVAYALRLKMANTPSGFLQTLTNIYIGRAENVKL
jgi:hypothetical protein